MKSCLKHLAQSTSDSSTEPSSSSCQNSRPCPSRTVSFRDKEEYEVHLADEWDRSPVDIARKLSYDDILELKEMQVAAARACARAHAANGSTSRYLSNVPLALLPLLPASGATAPPTTPIASPPHTPEEDPGAGVGTVGSGAGAGAGLGGGAGVTLAEACLCKVFSADTGVPSSEGKSVAGAQDAYGHRQSCAQHTNAIGQYSSNTSSTQTPAYQHYQAPFKQQSQHQIPSPPATPPRPLLTSIPPPPPTARARTFSFLPLLDASSSPSPSSSSSPSPSPLNASSPGTTSPPRISSPTYPNPTYSTSFSSFSSASASSSASSSTANGKSAAYSSYNPHAGYRGVGGSATLGLERKMGFASSDSESESESESESTADEDEDEEGDWRRGLHPCSSSSSSKAPSTSIPRLPPSPPAETSALPTALPTALPLSHPLAFIPVNPTSISTSTPFTNGTPPLASSSSSSSSSSKPSSSLRLSTSPTSPTKHTHTHPHPPSPRSPRSPRSPALPALPALPSTDIGKGKVSTRETGTGTKMNTGARKTIPLVMLA